MLRSKKIAITGGIATGKSTVCDFFEKLGCYVIRADEIVHNFLKINTKIGKEVIELLGNEIVDGNRIDRKKVAEIAFRNKTILKSLEKIIHPVVLSNINKKISKAANKHPFIFVEIPLLFEIGKEDYFDYVIAVISKESNCLERLAKKGVLEKEYRQRMLYQMSPKLKAQKADFIIENDSTLDELEKKICTFYHNFLAA